MTAVRERFPVSSASVRRWAPPGPFLPIAILGIVTIVLIVYPMVRVLAATFIQDGTIDLGAFAEAAALPGIRTTLLNTALVVTSGVGIALVVGSLFAWVNERTDARLGWLSSLLPIIPILVPSVSIAVGWVFLLSPNAGVVNVLLRTIFGLEGSGPFDVFSWYGLISLYSVELIPIVYLVSSAALRGMDPALEQASRVSGASPFRTLLRVTVPSMKPALAYGGWLALTIAMVLYSAPAVVGTSAGIDVLSVRMVNLVNGNIPPRIEVASALGTLLLAVLFTAWLVQVRIVRRSRVDRIGGKSGARAVVRLGLFKWPTRVAMVAFLLITTALPMLGLLLVSLQPFWTANIAVSDLSFAHFVNVVANDYGTQLALGNSVRLAIASATIIMGIALLVGLYVRERPSPLSGLLNGGLKLSAGFSHLIVAIGILLVFAGGPFHLSGTLWIVLIAYIVLYLPQGSIAAGSAISGVGGELIDASRVSGAGYGRTVRRVAFPLMLPGLVSGWILVFVYSVNDLTASVLLAGTRTPTVGYLILQEYSQGSFPVVAALALVIAVASTSVVLLALRFGRGSIGMRSE